MKSLCAIALAALAAGSASAVTYQELAQHLKNLECYAGSASYEILISAMPDPVLYSIDMESAHESADSLSPADYIIDWEMEVNGNTSSGFSSYFDGAHFRYRQGSMLQEYHYAWNPEVFVPASFASKGVQRQAQFTDILPQFIGEKLEEMASDSTYIYTYSPDSIVGGTHCAVIEGVRRTSGFDAVEFLYIFDSKTLMPVKIELDNNPGQIGEQSITVKYTTTTSPACNISMDALQDKYREIFEKYRESTFSLENLPGRPCPRITATTITGERYAHDSGMPFDAPTLIVFVDTAIGSTPEIVKNVREALSGLPMQVDVVWAFLDHRADDVAAVVPEAYPGETLLVNARGAARECGVGTVTPVIVFAAKDGKVSDIQIGDNQNLGQIVMQKVGLMAM